MSQVNLPVNVVEKVASVMESLPTVIGGLIQEAQATVKVSAEVRTKAEARSAELVKFAGLSVEKKSSMTDLLATHDGALQVVQSLARKVAEQQKELDATQNLVVGKPSDGPVKRSNEKSQVSQSSQVWVNSLLNV